MNQEQILLLMEQEKEFLIHLTKTLNELGHTLITPTNCLHGYAHLCIPVIRLLASMCPTSKHGKAAKRVLEGITYE